jgi:hypothetical protein
MSKHLSSIIVLTVLLSLAIVAFASDQTCNASALARQDCPTVRVNCPSEIPEIGQTYTLSADVAGTVSKEKLTYRWTLSSQGGEIVEGQGTASIKVYVKYTHESITATVEVSGLEDKCSKTASCTFIQAE